MTIAIHIDLLHFIGAKAFIDTLARGKDAFTPAVHEAMALGYTVLSKEYPQSETFRQALDAQATIYQAGISAFASGLAAKGEAGLKDAARQVYESVFTAAGLPATGLFKDASQDAEPVPLAASPDIVTYVTQKVRTCIAEQLGVQRDLVTSSKRLVADFGADSLDLIELTMAIEDEVEIEIQDKDAERVVVVQDAIDLAMRMLLAQKAPLPR